MARKSYQELGDRMGFEQEEMYSQNNQIITKEV